MKINKVGVINHLKKFISSKVIANNKGRKIKISVMVPTYNTDPEALKRLLASIDAQTMNKEEYELIFIDDGSTTEIYRTLAKLAKQRSNMIIKQIPNSGWGSRPRNIGTRLASGHYILYLDHDDTIFPEAFERVYEYGIKNNADVVNGKEVRTKGWSWGWDQFRENHPSAESLGIQSLLPMTPHKFYRREFLLDNEIEFNEGARVLWEDVYFNTKVFTSGAKVAILADYPVYYWIDTGVNNSSSFGKNPHEKWAQIRKLISYFLDTISNKEDLDFMLKHWYQSRVLGILGGWLLDKTEDRIKIEFDYAKKLAKDLIPVYIDEGLNSVNKVRANLLRSGNLEGLRLLAKQDKGVTARPYATRVHWIEDKLSIEAMAKLTIDEQCPFTYELRDEKIYRSIPEDLKAFIPNEWLDVTEEMTNSSFKASIKDRNTRVTWENSVKFSEIVTKQLKNDLVTLEGKMDVEIDIETAAMGAPLRKNPWDLAARFSAAGMTYHRGIVGQEGFIKAALINGKTTVVYTNKSNLLSLDIGSKVHSVVKVAKPRQEDVQFEINDSGKLSLCILLPRIETFGFTKVMGEIVLTKQTNPKAIIKEQVYLVGDEQGARIEAEISLPKGNYSITTIFEGKKVSHEDIVVESMLIKS